MKLVHVVITIILISFALVSGANAASPSQKKSPVKEKPPTESEMRDAEMESYTKLIDNGNTLLQYLHMERELNCVECTAAMAGTGKSSLDVPPAQKICKDKWTEFYNKDVIDLRITFGYIDDDVLTTASDYLQRQALIDQVTAPCEDNNFVRACGFKRSGEDQDIFEKQQAGPDGKPHLVRLRLTASAATVSDRLNRSLSEQNAQSAKAESQFYSGLCEAEMSIYVGHARNGGGPDFRPAIRRGNGTINLPQYQNANVGSITRVGETLRSCPQSTSKIIGFLACDSERWDRQLSAAAPKSGLLLSATPKINAYVPVAQAYLALDSVLWQRCNVPSPRTQGAFDEAMGQIPEYDDQVIIPVKLKNFFK